MRKHLCICILAGWALWPALIWGGENAPNRQAIEMEISNLDEATRKSLVQEMLGQINRNEGQNPTFENQTPAAPAAAPAPRIFNPEAQAGAAMPAVSASPIISESLAAHPAQSPWPQANDFFLPQKFENRGDFLPLENSTVHHSVIIPEQPDQPLLLTVGDVIYFPTPTFKALHPEERYGIYKLVKYRWQNKNAGSYVGLEAIGRLKILEVNQRLTIARVVSARDIIRQNDLIYLTDPQ